jgi:hypothetical protein
MLPSRTSSASRCFSATLAGGEVGRVLADPVERLALAALDPRDVDAERDLLVEVLLGKVIADDRDDGHVLREVRGRARDERRRPAEQILVEAERAVDVVERDRADDEEGAVGAALVHGSWSGTIAAA